MKMQTDFGTYDVKFKVSRYAADNSLAVSAWDLQEGPIATLAKCLDDKELADNEAYIDANNCPWALEFLAQNGLAELTGSQRPSGFCVYPQVRFNLDALRKELG